MMDGDRRAGPLSVLLLGLLLTLAGCPGDETSAPDDGPGSADASSEEGNAPAWLGLAVREGDLPEAVREEGGLLIRAVVEDSPASRAGLRSGDVMVRVEGNRIPTLHDFREWLRQVTPGSTLYVTVYREGADPAERTLPLTTGEETLGSRVDRTRLSAAAALDEMRTEEGGWPAFQGEEPRRTSPAVTALCLTALASLGPKLREARTEAIAGAVEWLASRQAPDGSIGEGEEVVLKMRAYATALTLEAFTLLDVEPEVREGLLAWLREHQLDEGEDVPPWDWHHGSWSYYPGRSRRTLRVDMSVHAHCVSALAAAGEDDPATLEAARTFVLRSRATRGGEGFAFSPRNSKAGMEVEGDGTLELAAYGSATADGLRSLLLAGALPASDEVNRAVDWIAENWRVDANPGFGDDPAGWGQGTLYYWLQSAARALAETGSDTLPGPGEIPWADELARAVIGLQEEDGLFRNESPMMHEDDPAVATSLAILALSAARPFVR